MQIQVRYFAVFRERLQRDSETVELPEGADVSAALTLLGERHPTVARLTGRFQTAVNQSMVPATHTLNDGDELALIPPVAGGMRRACIVEDSPSVQRCMDDVTSEAMGGLVTFTGVVRRQNRGKRVERLYYEAYRDMAEKVLHELCQEIENELPGCRLAVEHRVGTLDVGDIAVAIAAAAPHRKEAFRACEAMIDRLKERVPIWKKERTEDGDEWIGTGP